MPQRSFNKESLRFSRYKSANGKSRKNKLKEKLQKMKKAAVQQRQKDAKQKQKFLFKTTEYINKVLLKIPDSTTRYQMRKEREKTIVRQTLILTSRKKTKSTSLISVKKPDLMLENLRQKTIQKSMQDIATHSLNEENLNLQENKGKSSLGSRLFNRGSKRSQTILKNVPTTNQFLSPNINLESFVARRNPTKTDEIGSLIPSPKEGDAMKHAEITNFDSMNSLMTLNIKTESNKNDTENYGDLLLKPPNNYTFESNRDHKARKEVLKKPVKIVNTLMSSIKRNISKYFKAKPIKISPLADVKKQSLLCQNKKEKKIRINLILSPQEDGVNNY